MIGVLNVYLAARYSRREELLRYAADLEERGYIVTSRWLQGSHQIDDAGLSVEAKREERERFAHEDWEDLKGADACISFTEEPRTSNSRGGRHVEFGGALAFGQTVIVIGPRENVFHCLAQVKWFPDWESFMEVEDTETAERQKARGLALFFS